METIVEYVQETTPPLTPVSLVAGIDGFYERFGFEESPPVSKRMEIEVR